MRKREEMMQSYYRILTKQDSDSWTADNERTLKQLTKKIQQVTQGHLMEFKTLNAEINTALLRVVKLLGFNSQM